MRSVSARTLPLDLPKRATDREVDLKNALRGRVAIVFAGDTLARSGGAERRFIRLWAYLASLGADVFLITNEKLIASAHEAGLIDADAPHQKIISVPDAGAMRLSVALYRRIRELGCELVHLPLAQGKLLPLYALLQLTSRVRISHTVAAVWYAHRMRVALGSRLISRWLWSLADRIDSLYTGFAELHARPLGLLHKVTTSPCSFTDVERYSGVAVKDIDIVFAGAFNAEKNPLLFVDALASLRRRGIPFAAVMAGGGPQGESVKERVRAAGLRDEVAVGPIADMSSVFARSRIFVSLQQNENYPSQSLIEAMVARNAVVASDVGETRRLVTPDTGIVVPLEAEKVADAIGVFLTDWGRATMAAERGRELILREHRLDRFASYMVDVWNGAIEGIPVGRG